MFGRYGSFTPTIHYTIAIAIIIMFHFYRPQRSCGQGNIFTPVCHSVHRGRLPHCMLGYHPPGADTPPGADPPEQTPPPGSRLRHTVNGQPVRVLLECILVGIAIAIPIHPLEQNRIHNRNRVIYCMCELIPSEYLYPDKNKY